MLSKWRVRRGQRGGCKAYAIPTAPCWRKSSAAHHRKGAAKFDGHVSYYKRLYSAPPPVLVGRSLGFDADGARDTSSRSSTQPPPFWSAFAIAESVVW
eukprot:754354-Prymnesium_polylepis.3